jgi:hypothetical protein
MAATFELLVQIIQQQIGEQRRQRAALWRALVSHGADAVLHHPRRQEATDNPQQASVANAPRQAGHQDIVVDLVEKFFEVKINHDVMPVRDVLLGSEQRIMRSPSRAEAEARRRETRIEPRLKDLQDRLLDQAIHHRRDAQLALAAAGLGDFHPTHRLRLVAAIEQRGEQRVLVPSDPGPQSPTVIPSTPGAPRFAFTRL